MATGNRCRQSFQIPKRPRESQTVFLPPAPPGLHRRHRSEHANAFADRDHRPALAREVHALDANLAPYEVISLQEQMDRSTSPQRVAVTLLAILGGLALLLATVGLYAVMSYTVSQSSRELGLRMALGAGASNLLRLVLTHGLTITAAGLVLSTAAALLSARLLGNLLFKVSPRDPAAFASAFLVTAIAATAACFLPAWRATRTDPARILRD